MKHIVWDYEEGIIDYYNLYSVTDKGESVLDGAIILEVEKNKQNEKKVEKIVSALNDLIEMNNG